MKKIQYTNDEKQACINKALTTGNGRIFMGSHGVMGIGSGGRFDDTYIVALSKSNGEHDGQYIYVTETGEERI